MFHDGGDMAGMHGLWWMFWLIVLAAFLFFGQGRIGAWGGRHRKAPHDVLRRRLASGDLSPGEYEERKVLLDRWTVMGARASELAARARRRPGRQLGLTAMA